MRQEVTRTHKGWSLDTVTIDNTVLRLYKDDIREPPTEVNTSSNLEYLIIYRVFMSTVFIWKVLVGIERILVYTNHKIKLFMFKCLLFISLPLTQLYPVNKMD
jgi:hypothetical protein